MTVLVIAQYQSGKLSPATVQCFYQAQGFGERTDLLLMGRNCAQVAFPRSIANSPGTVHLAEADHLQGLLPEEAALVIRHLAGDYKMIVAAHSNLVAPVMARLAALLDVCPLFGMTRISDTAPGKRQYDCPVYSGAIVRTVQSLTPVQVVTLASSSGYHNGQDCDEEYISLENREDCQLVINFVDLPRQAELTHLADMCPPQGQGDNLDTARIVVGCGGGVESLEQLGQIEKLAQLLDATIGASKIAVDNTLLPVSQLIGQSGKTVAPDIYLALGISGSMHHLSAVLDSGLIISVNKDSEAPIFSFADYSLVGDIDEIVPELVRELEKGP